MVDEKVIVNEVETRVSYRAAYVIHFLLGAGSLIPWNALITAVDYFGYLYPDKHVEKTFTVAYMVARSCENISYLLMVGSVVLCGLADGLVQPESFLDSFSFIPSSACLRRPHWLRTEVPVVVLTFMQGLTSGYLTSVLRIMAPKTVHASEAELAAVFMVVFLGIGLVCGPVLGWVWLI
ncbi:unnamed protein product [Brassica rapa]|uniref:Uncharacterized protein n=1 Tax=Brassica campestris TaxID=3711 RepID=A0A3P6CSN2_BRACM|nr:unnamed protein product [Brassica rapa]VDD16698.1 unnamed protein product [Brassica rapa]